MLFTFSFLLFTLFEHCSVALPTSNFQIPDVYKTIAQDKGDFTVLEIPLAWRNGFRMTGTLDAAMMFAQWYQTAHRHPILGGNTSRNPELKFQYFTQAPVIHSILAVETGHTLDAATIQNDKQLAPEALRFFGVRYVVWHSPRNPQNRAALDAARAYIETVLPMTKFYDATDETGETIAYRVNASLPSKELTIRSDALGRLNFAEGWGALTPDAPIWATRREAKVFVRLSAPGNPRFSFSAFAPIENRRVQILVNGHALCAQELDSIPSTYACRALGASSPWRDGMNEIVFQFDAVVPTTSVHAAENLYRIGSTKTQAPVEIVAQSAGSEVGDFAHVYVDGVDAAKNWRGYNLVVLNEKTGAVETSAAFDTFASAEESARLAQFIENIPRGRIVAVAVRDEAARRLTEEAVGALRAIGATQDLRGKFRWAHAIIGVKGASPGTALESASETMPAQLVVGIGATAPQVAAAIEWLNITPAP